MRIELDQNFTPTPYMVLTEISIEGTREISGEVNTFNPSQVDIRGSILCITLNDFDGKATEQIGDNNWRLEITGKFNYDDSYVFHIADIYLESKESSTDISYHGDNIFYIPLKCEIFSDITLGESNSTSYHVMNPWNFEGHGGHSKTEIGSYVGNEKNVNLHKQLI